MKIYGYIRVSAGNQNEDRQLIKVYVFSGRFTICLFVIL